MNKLSNFLRKLGCTSIQEYLEKLANSEISYTMVKPDYANSKDVITMVRARILKAGFKIIAEGYIKYDKSAARKHYSDHIEKPFYPTLEKYITSDLAYGMIVAGENVVDTIHSPDFMGSTKNPQQGTVRFEGLKIMGYLDRDPRINGTENVAHSSDSFEAAHKESEIFLKLLEKTVQPSNDVEC